LHDLAVDLLDRLAASQCGDAAIKTTQRLLQLDPAREETHRLLMRLYATAGQRALALRQYSNAATLCSASCKHNPTSTLKVYIARSRTTRCRALRREQKLRPSSEDNSAQQ